MFSYGASALNRSPYNTTSSNHPPPPNNSEFNGHPTSSSAPSAPYLDLVAADTDYTDNYNYHNGSNSSSNNSSRRPSNASSNSYRRPSYEASGGLDGHQQQGGYDGYSGNYGSHDGLAYSSSSSSTAYTGSTSPPYLSPPLPHNATGGSGGGRNRSGSIGSTTTKDPSKKGNIFRSVGKRFNAASQMRSYTNRFDKAKDYAKRIQALTRESEDLRKELAELEKLIPGIRESNGKALDELKGLAVIAAEREKEVKTLMKMAELQKHVMVKFTKETVEREVSASASAKQELEGAVAARKRWADEEVGWIAEMEGLKPDIDRMQTRVDEFAPVFEGLEAQNEPARQAVEMNTRIAQRAKEVYANVARAVDGMGKTGMLLAGGFLAYVEETKAKKEKLEKAFWAEMKDQQWKQLINKVEEACNNLELDKTIPNWRDESYPWPVRLRLKAK
ncbi:hypothetical protein HK102_010743, partial [Quaeritorhiza haematococci]